MEVEEEEEVVTDKTGHDHQRQDIEVPVGMHRITDLFSTKPVVWSNITSSSSSSNSSSSSSFIINVQLHWATQKQLHITQTAIVPVDTATAAKFY